MNTKFFYSKASQRRRHNYIEGIKNANGVWVEEVEEVEEVAEVASDYFINIFTRSTCDKVEECLNTVNHRIIDDMLEMLSRSYSSEEVKATLFRMGPTKAPGLDDMNALFYQKIWHIVGRLITDNVVIAYETLHAMHIRKKGKKGALALKLNVSKAYDRVEWGFLKDMMIKLGFPEVPVIQEERKPKEARRIIAERKHRRLEKKENWKTQKKQAKEKVCHMLSSRSGGVKGGDGGKFWIGVNSNAGAVGGGGGVMQGCGGGGCEERVGISGAMMVVNNMNNKANMVEILGFWSWR
ncbi:hypothetical protein SO802_010840 [Lithocarpus litseifolius]|uniref:Reverse transcriptase domain-containing protein n=1 Tax=Lithocarpus litseifolius TaxID=425828 RepID=A0AAW2DIB3_9ROSI